MGTEPTIKLKVNLSIGVSNAEQTAVIDSGIPVSEWATLTRDEREERAHQAWEEWIWEHIDGGAEAVEDD